MDMSKIYPNAELIKIYPGEVDLADRNSFLPPIEEIKNQYQELKDTPISYFTFCYNSEKAQTEVWVQHPEKPVLGAFDRAAIHLMNNATKYPTTRWNFLWIILSTMFWWKFGRHSKWYQRHAVIAGHSELRLILTFRKFMEKQWHLSVLPCRFGKIFPWEDGELRCAFAMTEPVEKIEESRGMTHFLWSS